MKGRLSGQRLARNREPMHWPTCWARKTAPSNLENQPGSLTGRFRQRATPPSCWTCCAQKMRKARAPSISENVTLPVPFVPTTLDDGEVMMLKRTPLYETHKLLGGRMVEFAGWEMPVQYSSPVAEHLAVRQAAGLFDVSHMGEFEVRGDGALALLQTVTTND